MPSTRREFLAAAGAAAVSAACQSISGPRQAARPNFLFFFPDQHRADWVGWNPATPAPTPNLTALRNSGVSFANAVVDSPVCGPSRACLASGSVYERCGVRNNSDNYPVERVSYYKALRNSGYHVMGCGKLDLHKGNYEWGARRPRQHGSMGLLRHDRQRRQGRRRSRVQPRPRRPQRPLLTLTSIHANPRSASSGRMKSSGWDSRSGTRSSTIRTSRTTTVC